MCCESERMKGEELCCAYYSLLLFWGQDDVDESDAVRGHQKKTTNDEVEENTVCVCVKEREREKRIR